MNVNFICGSDTPCTFDNHVPAPYIRREFEVTGRILSADISICSTGFYILYINGVNVTKGILAPYISNPDHYCYCDCYDIKDYIKEGKNVIGIILGNGFANPFGGVVWDFDKAEFLAPPAVAVECDIVTDCQRVHIEADDLFKTHPSPILFDDERHGEIYDARLELEGWDRPGFDDSAWNTAIPARTPKGDITECIAEPIRKMREIKPVSIIPQDGGYLYDFGINTAGVCRLEIDAADGQKIYMRHGEVLMDGKFYDANIGFNQKGLYPVYDEYGQSVRYTAKGGAQRYTPHFCYMGFRYVFITGITEAQATDSLLTMLVYNSDIPMLAGFECSSERVNKLFDMAINSDLSNFYYFPTDCPHREKNGWTGDASMSADRMTTFYSVDKSYHQWLDNIRKAQRGDGALPGIVPTGGWGFVRYNGPAWDSVIFNLPYQLFIQRGDTDVIKENADAMMKYLDYIMTRRDSDGTVGIGLADWAPVNKKPRETTTSNRYTDSVMVMDMAKKAHKMLGAVGYDEYAQKALDIYEDMRTTVRRELIDKDTLIADGKNMACQALALYYGVFEPEEEQKAFDRLLEFIHANGDRFDVGFLGQHVLYHVLSRFGEGELAYKMIVAPGFPSFGDLLDRGYTSVTEHFREDPQKVSSLNHHFQSEYAHWFITAIAGIDIIGRQTVRINPIFVEDIDWVRAHVTLPEGRVSIAWTKNSNGIDVKVDAPDGVAII